MSRNIIFVRKNIMMRKDSRKQVRKESYGISNRHFVQAGRGEKATCC
jgi:hypothetical protein